MPTTICFVTKVPSSGGLVKTVDRKVQRVSVLLDITWCVLLVNMSKSPVSNDHRQRDDCGSAGGTVKADIRRYTI
jgi:hypothetical protein